MDEHASELRQAMVDRLVKDATLSAPVEAALRAVPRHVFLPGLDLERVYSGDALITRTDDRKRPISSSSQVSIMAPMLEHLDLHPGLSVLEIGAGTGYNAALLDELVGPTGAVTTVDIDPEIVAEARERLAVAGHSRVRVVCGDGWSGIADGAPFDRLMVTASVADLSPAWVDQLVEGGRLVVPLRVAPAQAVVALRKRGDVLESVAVVAGGFMPLRGAGAPDDRTQQIDEWSTTASRPIDPDAFRSLVSTPPRLELAGPLDSMKTWLLALLDDDSLVIGREGQIMSTGLFSSDGLAVVQITHGGLTGVQALLLCYGSSALCDRLRELVGLVRDRSFADLCFTARPTTPDERSAGRYYRFTVGLQ